ncbi:hypothetical protein RUM44_004875 [Polyplax serrata]|uniref:Uncharacterized protein n=1 Tax=Polyplax serrata TaxID=468196 RepID=A0ABR1B420_POLSC
MERSVKTLGFLENPKVEVKRRGLLFKEEEAGGGRDKEDDTGKMPSLDLANGRQKQRRMTNDILIIVNLEIPGCGLRRGYPPVCRIAGTNRDSNP